MGHPETRQRFEEIYLAYYADLLAYIRRRVDSHEDAADALAETFTTAWRRLPDVPDGHAARLWLYGVARRTLANGRRTATRRSALVERLSAQLADWAGSADPPDNDLDAVRAAYRRLHADDREVLALVSWEGLTSEEAATVLGCSPGAARSRLHRARKRLARELSRAGVDVARYGVRALALAGRKA
ncbi:RNA polymerase sigma factor [Microtetraspora niveoalba]|uniref:RNA polymerase sigma factor n=1 Tax=Microtetraspora niveoalba TaxID=46175 RepID=UPI0008329F76|nr:RNA polymerase sigma factor [Microtetraspora niveoalba]